MIKAVFDIEANALLDDLDIVHSLVVQTNKDSFLSCTSQKEYPEIQQGIELLQWADLIIGHNIICYDIPAIKKALNITLKPNVFDTMVASQLIFTNLMLDDFKAEKIPPKLYGNHGLKAWGFRLGIHKGEYSGGWDKWSKDMQDYCEQDVLVTAKLYQHIMDLGYSKRALDLEHAFQKIIFKQERSGVLFNTSKANILAGELDRKITGLKHRFSSSIRSHVRQGQLFEPKRNNKPMGYTQGTASTKVFFEKFNAGSRDQVAKYLIRRYGWEPTELTPTGLPKVNDEILNSLPYTEAKDFAKLFSAIKIYGYVTKGKESWLNHVTKSGRIHGHVITNGAVTGRCTHSKPNLAQVPSQKGYLGHECRDLFHSGRGYMLGVDAFGLELRCLAHYLAKYDGGSYAKEILNGDVHTANQRAANLPSRDQAKTFIYAFIYGAGDAKLGSIVQPDSSEDRRRSIGKSLRSSFLAKVSGLGQLIGAVRSAARVDNTLIGIDGRKLHIRAQHVALNTLLQGAGAVIMKQAAINFWDKVGLNSNEIVPALAIHDEYQCVVNSSEKRAHHFGQVFVEAIKSAGEDYNFRCPLDGEYKVGKTWAQTH